jgi:hypothetical protein
VANIKVRIGVERLVRRSEEAIGKTRPGKRDRNEQGKYHNTYTYMENSERT